MRNYLLFDKYTDIHVVCGYRKCIIVKTLMFKTCYLISEWRRSEPSIEILNALIVERPRS